MVLVSAGTGRDRHAQSAKTVTRMGCVVSKEVLATTLCQQKVGEVGQGIFTRVWLLAGRKLGDGRPAVRQRGGGTTGWGRCTHCRNLKRESRVAAEAARTN